MGTNPTVRWSKLNGEVVKGQRFKCERTAFQMRIQYKITSALALCGFALGIASMFLPAPPPNRLSSATGAVGWDPCTAWVQYGAAERPVGFIWFGAFVVFTTQGLRDRPGPRWLALAAVVALLLGVQSDWWRIAGGCYSTPSLILWFIWLGTLITMFMHHAVQPAQRVVASDNAVRMTRIGLELRAGALWTLVRRNVYAAFVFMLLAWCILNRVRVLTYDGDDVHFSYLVTIALQHCVAWAAFGFFVLAAALGFQRLITRRKATRT